jgi:hypothetical protein
MRRQKYDRREGLYSKDPTTWGQVRPPTDAERLLGQIERGEVRIGPEAAREIARRHMAAYGAEVWGD